MTAAAFPQDRWQLLLQNDRAERRAAGTLPEPVAPIIPPGVKLPIEVHFTASIQLLGGLYDYGDSTVIGEPEVVALADTAGRISVLELLDDADGQRRRWGSHRIRRGPWPAGASKIQPGSSAWEVARRDQFSWARSRPFQSERDEAMEAALRQFGSEHGPCSAAIARTAYGYESPE